MNTPTPPTIFQHPETGKVNFRNHDGSFLSPQWFDDARDFRNGFASIKRHGKGWNFIKPDGGLLSDQWFDRVWGFEEGFAPVLLNGKFKTLSTDSTVPEQP